MIDFALTDVFAAVLIIALLILVFVSWRFVREWVKGSEYERFIEMVEAAVSWAEQTMQTKEGQEKYQQVLAQLQAAFPKLDVSFIAVFVEKYVRDMKEQNEFRESITKKVNGDGN
jgi:hypothetical protein